MHEDQAGRISRFSSEYWCKKIWHWRRSEHYHFAIVVGLFAVVPLSAQSLTGTTGLVSIPTAEMPADGALAAGVMLLDERYQVHQNPRWRDRAAMTPFASLGFLPFMEVGLRFTRVIGIERQALGDRMVSVRLRMLKEGKHTPAVVLGVHDLVGTRIYHAEYVAASKHVDAGPLLGTVGVHAGYGGDWLSLDASGRQFVGVFGGVSVAPRRWVVLMLEHDAERINAGVRLRVWRFAVLGAAHGLEGVSGGISYTHPLK
jgi:hypothetical protein